jgi:uncharacterized membrane protein
MRRLNVFIASLLTSIIALLVLMIIGFNLFASTQASQQYPSGWMGQMWGGMMGQNGATQATSSAASFLWALFAAVAAITIISVIGLVYYLAYPQIKLGIAKPTIASAINQSANITSPYESIEKTLTHEERKVINVLNAHEGKYLQKYITKETGLSKLKTHRVVARLAERGIVSSEKMGNTNQVYLANWLQEQKQT